MPNILFTGFPGFLGSELLPRILGRAPDAIALCIVQPKFIGLARSRAASLVALHPALENRIRLVEGDITAPDLGTAEPLPRVSEIYHLAAVYDLAVPRNIGVRVNVDGTRNVLSFAGDQPGLVRLHYVSTCYVSGRFEGVFRESDLDRGQTFNNFYEETKYLAEIEVQRRMKSGMPVTIYRPAIVVGDSLTGATQKFDGPYYMMQLLMRQPRWAMLPVNGDPRRFHFNVVPSDFIVRAIESLSALPEAAGKVYQLADPAPLSVDQMIDAVGNAVSRKVLRIPIPASIAKASIRHVPGVYRLMRVPADALDYMTHPTDYDTTNSQRDLAPAGIAVPQFREYLPHLVDFVRAHPETGSAAMV